MGAGHLVRGLAIQRALDRAGFHGEYRMFGPAQPYAHVAGASSAWTNVVVDPAALASSEHAPASDVAIKLRAFDPDVLLVDMFWAPLRHVLPLSRRSQHWLLLRSYPPTWLEGPPGLPFEPAQFERIVAIEPHLPSLLITHRLEPVVILNPDEQQPPEAARRRFGVTSAETKLVGIMHAGNAGEHARIVEMANAERDGDGADHVIASFDLAVTTPSDALFPVAAWLGGCDRLYTGAGYNSFWEAHWLGYASRTRFHPFARRNDNHGRRIDKCLGYAMRANGADLLARALTEL